MEYLIGFVGGVGFIVITDTIVEIVHNYFDYKERHEDGKTGND